MGVLCSECGALVAKPVVGRAMLCAKCEAKHRAMSGPVSDRDDENLPTMDAPPPEADDALAGPPHSRPNPALAGSPTRPMPTRPPPQSGNSNSRPAPRPSQPPRNYSAPPGPRVPMGSQRPPPPAPRPSTFPLAPNRAAGADRDPSSASAPPPSSPVSSPLSSPAASSARHPSAPNPLRPNVPRPGAAAIPSTRPAPSPSRRPAAPPPPHDHEASAEFSPVETGELEPLKKDDDVDTLATGDFESVPQPPKTRPPTKR